MLLEKWYADVVDAGRCTLVYRARLHLGPTLLTYARHLDSEGESHVTLRGATLEMPLDAGGTLAWPLDQAAGGTGWRWQPSATRTATLWRHGRHALAWSPLVLNGRVSGAGLSRDARGYAERLTLDFAPWRLGLQRLRWGRFCGESHALAWIEWEGRHPLRLAILDGRALPMSIVTQDRIECEGVLLQWSQPRVIVDETLRAGSLRGLHLPRGLEAVRFFSGVERKRYAPGELRVDGGACDRGYVVFEEVVWS